MGLFRRRELSDDELRAIAEELRSPEGESSSVRRDSYVLRAGADGRVHDHCWFCGAEIQFTAGTGQSTGVALLIIEPVGDGEPIHGVCHEECAELARGSIALRG